MPEPIPRYSLTSWTRAFAETLVRLYPQTDPSDASGIAHGRFFVDEGLDPTQAAELYALSEGNPIRRRGLGSQERMTFRALTERFMHAGHGFSAFTQLARDADELIELDPRNDDIYAGVRSIAVWHVMRRQADDAHSDAEARDAHAKVLRACFRLVIALSGDPALRARTLGEALAECRR